MTDHGDPHKNEVEQAIDILESLAAEKIANQMGTGVESKVKIGNKPGGKSDQKL